MHIVHVKTFLANFDAYEASSSMKEYEHSA